MKLAAFILGSMSLLIQQYVDKYRDADLNKTLEELEGDLSLPRITSYDFIVVGGGSAGCLIAGRLSEKFSVLLLESGGPPPPATYNPYFFTYINSHPAINYFYPSVPQTNFSLEDGGIVESIPGKMLGGSGSHNGNVYNRGSPKDYDNFAKLVNDSSWEYQEMVKHYQRIENFTGLLVMEKDRAAQYGSGGPLGVDTDTPPIFQAWMKSAQELGYKVGDPNGNQTEAFTPMAKTIHNGERVSSYTAFIKPFMGKRETLRVLPYSEVDEVLIDDDNKAYGVRYKRHGIPQISYASKEVIVSAGTFASPLLLIRSGIGPKEVLDKAEIPVKSDLPGVGKNLRDHVAVVLTFSAYKPDTTMLTRVDKSGVERELGRFAGPAERKGYFTRLDVGPQALLVSSAAKAKGETDWPDIQIVFQQEPILGEEVEDQPLAMQVVVNRLESVGEIGFNTTAFLEGERDDTKLGLVDHRLMTKEHDVEAMIEAIKTALKIMEGTTPFQAMNVTYNQTPPEACKSLEFRSDEYWRCYIGQRAWSWLHVTGTCKMGNSSDPMAVVDSKLRVRGIKNLRVVDASVMPQPTNVNTNAPTMALAEKTSQEIFSEYFPADLVVARNEIQTMYLPPSPTTTNSSVAVNNATATP